MNIIVRIQKNHENRSQITNAIRIANGFQNYFFFKMEDYCLEDICAGTKIHWNSFVNNIHAMRMSILYI